MHRYFNAVCKQLPPFLHDCFSNGLHSYNTRCVTDVDGRLVVNTRDGRDE